MSKKYRKKTITEVEFQGLVNACNGWTTKAVNPVLPKTFASISSSMPGYTAHFFSGSISNPDGPKIGQMDILRREPGTASGSKNHVKKYSRVFYREGGDAAIFIKEIRAKNIPNHHSPDIEDEFAEYLDQEDDEE